MDIKAIPLHDLERFAREHVFHETGPGQGEDATTPISLHRAHAWTRNPLAEPEDVVLIAALDGGRCIGYLGMLPGEIRLRGTTERIYWGSTYYVPPFARETGVGMLLILHWLRLRRSIFVAGASKLASQALQGMRFLPLRPLRYSLANLNLREPWTLPSRSLRQLARRCRLPTTPFDRLVDASRQPHKALIYFNILRDFNASLEGLRIEPFQKLSAKHRELMQAVDDGFVRGPETIDWMLDASWITNDRHERTPAYYFDDYRPLFQWIRITLSVDGQDIGFAIFRLDRKHGNRNLTLLDHRLRDAGEKHRLVAAAMVTAKDWAADKIALPFDCRAVLEAKPTTKRLFHDAERHYLCYPAKGSVLQDMNLDEIELAMTDGDIPFA